MVGIIRTGVLNLVRISIFYHLIVNAIDFLPST